MSVRALSPQHALFAAWHDEAGEQHDRFLAAEWQHALGPASGAATFCLARADPLVVAAGVAQLQARAGAAAPIPVETASRTQRKGRTLRAVDTIQSYSRTTAQVNLIEPAV